MRSSGRPWHISHRGGSLESPENTLHAFRRAIALGTDMLELDLRATADGHVVVFHDETVERTTDGVGAVADLSLDELRRLDAARWFSPGAGAVRGLPDAAYPLRGQGVRIPTFEEVLEGCPGARLTMEIKTGPPTQPAYHEQVAALIDAFDRHDTVIVGSFHDEVLEPFRQRCPETPTSATQAEAGMFWAEGALPAGRRIVALQVPVTYRGVEVVTHAFVSQAHGRGLAVHVWTVDEEAEMHRLAALGVDGIMTDRPTLLRDVLAGLAREGR